MRRLATYTRRGFLLVSVAVAGGVAFGVWQAKRTLPNPLHPGAGAATLNPYLIIDQSGVSIIVPRAEMGQGVHTTLAALVAEELDVAWDSIRVIHGPAAQVYYNGAALKAALPFPDYALTRFQERLRAMTDVVPKMLGIQITGGSTSTVDAFDKMRQAGASAREALKAAASSRLSLPISQLATESGAVITRTGLRVPYGDLAEAAAQLPAPDVRLRRPADWKYLGKSMPRTDMLAKITGTATYGIDTRQPGMVFATVRLSPHRGAMLSFDAKAARTMPGVQRILNLGTGIAVVASNTWLAFQAAAAVEIKWADAAYPPNTEAIFAEIAGAFDTEPNSTLRDHGDVDAALTDTVVEAEYRVPYLAHSTMEPMNAAALFVDRHLTLWCGTQAPVIAAQKAAEAVGLHPEAVTVHTTLLGGGFGRRAEFDFAVLAARLAQAVPGVPVLVTWSREEDMTHDFYRPGAIARFAGGLVQGRAAALSVRLAAPSVTRQAGLRLAGIAGFGPDKAMVEGLFDQPYAIPNYHVQGLIADVAVPIGFWRSVGSSHNGFFHESFIDELAHAAGRDPLEFRIGHVRPAHEPSAKLLEAVGAMSGWSRPKAPGTGRGVALCYSFGTPVAEVIEVIDQSGEIRIARAWIAVDPGRALDPGIIEAQMKSGLIYGLSAAVMGEITFGGGAAEQTNFHDYDALRLHTAPAIEVRILENNRSMGGIGEPGTPPAAPALANALFDLTGIRARELPLNKVFSFVK